MTGSANGSNGRRTDGAGMVEGQKVYVPDPHIAWARATVVCSLRGSRYEVSIDKTKDASLTPHQKGHIQVDVSGPGFEGMDSLPLQNSETSHGDGVEDMCSLNHLHEPAILYNLRQRFMRLLPYTYTGEICIAINPYQWLDLYGKDRGRQYKQASKRSDLPPHVFATSAQAFKGLQKYGKNQSILVSGESGAGKTETVKILLDHLAATAGAHANDRTIEKVITSNPLLESFGNAKTLRNDNSSRFGKFTELQLDDRCRLSGSRSNTYLLEKVRVVSHARGERTYHIFYQLLAASDGDKRKYSLEGKRSADFRYTEMGGDKKGMIEGMSDGDRFQQTSKALQVIGMSDAGIKDLLSAVSGVLHLGQIEFEEVNSDSGQHGSEARDPKLLDPPARMLGVSAYELGHHLTHRIMQVEGESIDVPLSPQVATDGLDGLAKEVYCRVFDWLVAKINSSTHCAKGTLAGTIDLLDIFGFETFEHNSFEQFCINYANEKLQQKFTQDVFKNVQVEYQEEGIPWSHIDFQDNAQVLGMIEEHRKGLLSLLDEECMLPRGSDEAYASKAAKAYTGHPNFSRSRLASNLEFTVHHYAGQVVYNATGFVEKNKDQLQADLVQVLSKSSNRILSECFVSKSSEDYGPDGSPPSPGRSRQRKGSLVQESLGSKFKRQLHALMAAIERTEVQYVRCIKPNANKSKDELNCAMVVEQLRCAGVIEAIRISRAAYPNRMVFREFVSRFAPLANRVALDPKGSSAAQLSAFKRRDASGQCRHILDRLLGRAANSKCCLGNTKVYFRAGVLEQLEEERNNFVREKVTTVQRVLIGNAKRRPYLRLRKAAVTVQANVRAKQSRQRFVGQRAAAIKIQTLFRGYRARKATRKLRQRAAENLRRKKEAEAAEKKRLEKMKAEEDKRDKAAASKAAKSAKVAKAAKADAGGNSSGSAIKNILGRSLGGKGTGGGDFEGNDDSPHGNGAAVVGIVDGDDSDDEVRDFRSQPGRKAVNGSATPFSRMFSSGAGVAASNSGVGEDETGETIGRYNPLFHNATRSSAVSGGKKGEENYGLRVNRRQNGDGGSPRTTRRMHFLEFNPRALDGFMKTDMRGFLANPVPRKGGTVKCFIRREKRELVRGLGKIIGGAEVYKLYMEGKGDFPDKYLMTAKKKSSGATPSQFVIAMDEHDDSEKHVIGRLKATSRTSEEFQIFSPQGPDGQGKEKEVAAVHYSADKMDPHGRYDGPRKMRVVLGNLHGNNSDVEAETSLLHRMLRGSLDDIEEPCLINRNPRWNSKVQAFVLNFHGRVTQASVKNFQLVVQGDESEQITLQFGRTHTNEFTMDFCHPLSPLQALAITLTSFDCK